MIYNGIEYTQIPYAPTYYISRCGKVLRVNGGRTIGIKQRIDMFGYMCCNVSKPNAPHSPVRIHRLLAITFLSLDVSCNKMLYKTHVNHIDGNKLNNSLSNLEVIGMDENQRHYQINTNKFGIGVTYHKGGGKYTARIQFNGKRRHIGLYSTPEQAQNAYIDAFIRYGLRDKYVEQLPAYKEAMMLKGVGVSIV